jgi:phosphate starvation-inducible PhoH-like protein
MRKRKKSPTANPAPQGLFFAPKKTKLNQAQENFARYLNEKPIVFGVGVAGTGKTFAAIWWARQAIQQQIIEKVIYVRSPMEMGMSRLGFLPGGVDEKMAPYVRPMKDIARELGIADELIEFMPLGYVQGVTFKNCLVIVDEVQNMTVKEFKNLVSRLGIGGRMAVTGDPEQDTRNANGLETILKIMSPLSCVAVQNFESQHNRRHPCLEEVIPAFRGAE